MEEEIGKVTNFYKKVLVAVVKLSGELKVGDKIHVIGPVIDIIQKIESMQVQHKDVDSVSAGDAVGIKLIDEAHEGDIIYIMKD